MGVFLLFQILVLLDVAPDQSMLDQGVAREVINRVQRLRKKVWLQESDGGKWCIQKALLPVLNLFWFEKVKNLSNVFKVFFVLDNKKNLHAKVHHFASKEISLLNAEVLYLVTLPCGAKCMLTLKYMPGQKGSGWVGA